MYFWVKHLHLLTVALSISLFILRVGLRCRGSRWLQTKWLKIAPHLNDTILLASGLTLAMISRHSPFSTDNPWLIEKLVLVVLYIGLGHLVLSQRAYRRSFRVVAFILAISSIAMIVYLAHTQHALLIGLV